MERRQIVAPSSFGGEMYSGSSYYTPPPLIGSSMQSSASVTSHGSRYPPLAPSRSRQEVEAEKISKATCQAISAARSIIMSGGTHESAMCTAQAAAKSVLRPSTSKYNIGGKRRAKQKAQIIASMAVTSVTSAIGGSMSFGLEEDAASVMMQHSRSEFPDDASQARSRAPSPLPYPPRYPSRNPMLPPRAPTPTTAAAVSPRTVPVEAGAPPPPPFNGPPPPPPPPASSGRKGRRLFWKKSNNKKKGITISAPQKPPQQTNDETTTDKNEDQPLYEINDSRVTDSRDSSGSETNSSESSGCTQTSGSGTLDDSTVYTTDVETAVSGGSTFEGETIVTDEEDATIISEPEEPKQEDSARKEEQQQQDKGVTATPAVDETCAVPDSPFLNLPFLSNLTDGFFCSTPVNGGTPTDNNNFNTTPEGLSAETNESEARDDTADGQREGACSPRFAEMHEHAKMRVLSSMVVTTESPPASPRWRRRSGSLSPRKNNIDNSIERIQAKISSRKNPTTKNISTTKLPDEDAVQQQYSSSESYEEYTHDYSESSSGSLAQRLQQKRRLGLFRRKQ